MQIERSVDECDYRSCKILPFAVRANVNSTRNFPRGCGPSSSNGRRGNHDFSGVENTKTAAVPIDGVVVSAKPIRMIKPSALSPRRMKPNVPHDVEPDAVKKNFAAQGDKKFDLAGELGKAKSVKVAANGVWQKETENLADLKGLSKSMEFASEFSWMKVRTKIISSRDFPSKCGEEHVSFSNSGVVNNKRSCLNARPNERSIKDENQDCRQTLNSFGDGNVVKDGTTYCEHVQVPSGPEFDWVEKEEIYVRPPSEWNLLKSRFKHQDARKKDIAVTLFIEQKGKHSQEHSLQKFAEVDRDEMVVSCDKGPETREAKNLCIVPYDESMAIVSRSEVQNALKQYEELYSQLLQKYGPEFKREGRVTKHIHIKAATTLKDQQKWVNFEPIFGHVPGVEIGDQFRFRAELALVGLHHQHISGINCVTIDGKKYANSIVDSGRYVNKITAPNVFVYSGQGGIHKALNEKADQKLVGGNLALKNSMDANYPVRVIRKTLGCANTGCASGKKVFIYVGLYTVSRFWQERDQNGKLAFMFELIKMAGESDHNNHTMDSISPIGLLENHINVGGDVSQGKEEIPICLVNAISNEKPLPFTYITEMRYPDWHQISMPSGCNCINGCSDYEQCSCTIKNGGEIPFNEEGSIIKAKRFIYECGPSCKCPPSCHNRVSQHGLRYQLEVFKTQSTGWGVRSRDEIPSGGFICEYIGELLQDKEAEQRIDNDEYLFDLDKKNGFTIDAANYGNLGRFINHSCTPNLYAQNVLYDHCDKRLPHIMLFATRKIPAFEELTYDYNYKIGRVCDADGNIKTKVCHCGSSKCTRRMY